MKADKTLKYLIASTLLIALVLSVYIGQHLSHGRNGNEKRPAIEPRPHPAGDHGNASATAAPSSTAGGDASTDATRETGKTESESSRERQEANGSRSRDETFEWNGIQWLVPDHECVVHDSLPEKIPPGFETAPDEELRQLRATYGFKAKFPFLFKTGAAVWSNRKEDVADKWYVVSFSTGDATSRVPDLCAYTLVKRSSP